MKWSLQSVSRVRLSAWLVAAVCGLAGAPLEAQLFDGGGLFNRKTEAPRAQTEDEIGVPTPVTGRVEALKGNEVTFEIRAESKTPAATVEFLIRTFPSAGKIVSLVSKPNDRNKALVTYWADPSSSATEDAFSFAVRYRGGRYSSEMRYDISLVDLKTEIQVPAQVDFGEVMIGNEEVREITVRNLGGAAMERQVFLAPPWHLVEPADGRVNLGPRGSRVLKVAFRPELMGETSYFLSFSRSKEGTTKLIGKGGDPFSLLTEAIELTLDEKTNERIGEIQLQNHGSKPLAVEARASTRLQSSLLDGYLLAPGQVTKVAVRLGGTDTAPFDGTVEFFLKNGYAKSARVIAPVVPGRLVVSVPNSITAEVINFGKVEAGRSMERGITITNPGGVAVPLEFHVPEPFRLLTNPGPQLGPLSTMNLSIGLFPTASSRGLVDVTMNVYGNEQTVPIRLLGNVVAPTGAAPSAPTASLPNFNGKQIRLGAAKAPEPATSADVSATFAATPDPNAPKGGNAVGNGAGTSTATAAGDEEGWPAPRDPSDLTVQQSPLGFDTRDLIQREVDASLRRPEDLTALKSTSDSITLGWTAPRETGPVSYEVEMRGLVVNQETGVAESVWAPYPVKKIEKIDRLVKADLERLLPVTQYEVRVVITTPDGRSSPPSAPIVVKTELPMDWTYIYAFLGLLALVGLGIGIWKIYLARRPEVYQTQYVDM